MWRGSICRVGDDGLKDDFWCKQIKHIVDFLIRQLINALRTAPHPKSIWYLSGMKRINRAI